MTLPEHHRQIVLQKLAKSHTDCIRTHASTLWFFRASTFAVSSCPSCLTHQNTNTALPAAGLLPPAPAHSLPGLVFQTTNFVCLPLVSSLFLVARSSLLFLVRFFCLQTRRSLAAGSMKRFVVGCGGGEELSMKGLMSSPLLSLYLFTCTIFSASLSLRTCATTLQLQA
jgi:hypothetical protein